MWLELARKNDLIGESCLAGIKAGGEGIAGGKQQGRSYGISPHADQGPPYHLRERLARALTEGSSSN